MSNNNKTDIINKLFENQLKDIEPQYRLNSKDIVRLSSYINSDPFDDNTCCKWLGAISRSSHNSKYINFWFNKKKQALHRILYLNYIGELPKNKYLRFNCPNQNMRGVCCNINHLELINEESDELNNSIDETDNLDVSTISKQKNENINIVNDHKQISIEKINNNIDKNKFYIVFDDY